MCELCLPHLNGKLYDSTERVLLTMYLWNLESVQYITYNKCDEAMNSFG